MNLTLKETILRGILPTLAGVAGVGLLIGAVYFANVKLSIARSEIVNLWQPILAMIVILIVIGLLAGAYKAFRLSNHSFALGLPNGSIRAILAMSFIVIFTTVAILLLSNSVMNTEYESVGTVEGLTQAQYEDYRANIADGLQFAALPTTVEIPQADGQPAKSELRWGGELFRVKASKDGLDIAKQILTALITALSVVTGFYFGSRAVNPDVTTPDLQVDKSQIKSGVDMVTRIDKIVATIGAIEANLKERLSENAGTDVAELIIAEHEEIVDQLAIAEEASGTARTIHAEMVSETGEAKLAAAVEQLNSALETAERALAQAQAAMGRAHEVILESPVAQSPAIP